MATPGELIQNAKHICSWNTFVKLGNNFGGVNTVKLMIFLLAFIKNFVNPSRFFTRYRT